MHISSGLLYGALWKLEFGELVKNADTLTNAIPVNNETSFMSDPGDLVVTNHSGLTC